MSVMVLDSGNSIIKTKIARRQNGEIAFPHAMKQLTESEYGKITNRIGLKNQFAIIYESMERFVWWGKVLNAR